MELLMCLSIDSQFDAQTEEHRSCQAIEPDAVLFVFTKFLRYSGCKKDIETLDNNGDQYNDYAKVDELERY